MSLAQRFLVATLVGSLGQCLCLEPLPASATADGNGARLKDQLLHFFSVMPEMQGNELNLVVVSRGVDRNKDILCEPLSDEIPFMVEVALVFHCLEAEAPDRFSSNILASPALQEVAALAKARLQEGLQEKGGAEGLDERALFQEAQDLFMRSLKESAVLPELVAAWRRHVEGRSPCYVEILARYKEMLDDARKRAQSDGTCESWSRYLGICTSEEEDLRKHIYLFGGPSLNPERRKAIQALIQRSLSACMARILEACDPELAEEIRHFNGNGGGLREGDALTQRAWRIWREHGVHEWLDRTLENGGTIPPDVIEELDSCVILGVPECSKTSAADERPTPMRRNTGENP